MEILLSIAVGLMITCAIYMLLSRNIIKILIGILILGNTTNLLIFTMGRLTKGTPPIIVEGQQMLTGTFANPLPQALILTAIVIGFGLTAFIVSLSLRLYTTFKTIDTDNIKAAEPKEDVSL